MARCTRRARGHTHTGHRSGMDFGGSRGKVGENLQTSTEGKGCSCPLMRVGMFPTGPRTRGPDSQALGQRPVFLALKGHWRCSLKSALRGRQEDELPLPRSLSEELTSDAPLLQAACTLPGLAPPPPIRRLFLTLYTLCRLMTGKHSVSRGDLVIVGTSSSALTQT